MEHKRNYYTKYLFLFFATERVTVKIIWVLIFLTACSSINKKNYTLIPKHDGIVSYIGHEGDAIEVKAGIPLSIENKKTFFYESPGKIGLLIIPHESKNEMLEVNLRDDHSWQSESMKKKNGENIDLLLAQIQQVQWEISQGKAAVGLAIVEELIVKYSFVNHLHFLKAGCLLLLKEKTQARTVLISALRKDPNNEYGKKLFKNVFGDLKQIEMSEIESEEKRTISSEPDAKAD